MAMAVAGGRRLPPGAALVAALAALWPGAAWAESADVADTLDFVAGAGYRYEDNLFRLADGVDAADLSRSDQVYTANAGIRLDKPYGLQRFQLEAMVSAHNYQNNSFLDYTALDYRAAWLWQLTPRVSGIVLAERAQALNNFSDLRDVDRRHKSVQTNETRLITIDGDIGAGVHLLGGLLDVRSRNSQDFEAVGDYRQQGVELGAKYVARSSNWVSLLQRETRGSYEGRELDPVARLDDGFDQHETEAKVGWRLSGKSWLEGRLGYVQREHAHFAGRDYAGATGRLLYRWTPSGKLRLDLSLARNLYSFQEDGHSYYIADSFSAVPAWQATAKTSFSLKYDYTERDYRGAIVALPETRQDSLHSLALGAHWQATRKLSVNAALEHQRRDSNLPGLDFDANAVGINAELLF